MWQERMNAKDRNKDLKAQKVQGGAVLKGAFPICKVSNDLINLFSPKLAPLTKDVPTPSEFE